MSRREYTIRLACTFEGCKERSFTTATTRREETEIRQQYQRSPYRCVRHTNPDEVLSAAIGWQQYISRALGCKPGQLTYQLEECIEKIEALKPAPITSLEELAALPAGSVIKLPDGDVGMIMVARDKRHVVGYPQCLLTNELGEVIRSAYGDPIRVLFTPGDAG